MRIECTRETTEMEKLYALLLFLNLQALYAQTTDWSWIRAGGGSADDAATHMTLDNSGNLLVTGYFASSSLALNGATLSNSGAPGSREAFLLKYDRTGNLLWSKRGQGNGDDESVAVSTDPTGNIYLAGNYESSTISFGTVTLTNSSAFNDMFLVKYDPAGNVLWARTYGGNLLETVSSLEADNFGNTYLTGSFRSLSVSFGTVGVINSGNSDAFLVKIDVNGNPLWARQIGGAQDDLGTAVTYDGNGNVYVMGDYNSSALTTYSLGNAGLFDMFLGKYDASSGSLLAWRNIGGASNENGSALVTDASGNLYVSGTFESSSLNLSSTTLSNGSTRDMMLIKTNPSLTVVWAVRNNGNFSSRPSGLFVDGSSNLIMSGYFTNSTLAFSQTTLTNPNTGSEGFFARFSLAGTNLDARATNSGGDERIMTTVADNSGSTYICGSFGPSLALGPVSATSIGTSDLFVAKRCNMPASPTIAAAPVICKGGSGTLNATAVSGATVSWHNASSGGNQLGGGNNFTINNAGTFYASAVFTVNGCSSPSRSAVQVSVQPAPVVSVSGATLTSGPGTTFQWIECAKDSLIAGATAPSFTVAKTGYYAVIVSNNGCTDTSACKLYSVSSSGTVTVPGDTVRVSLAEVPARHSITIYPNPARDHFVINAGQDKVFRLTDATGKIVRSIPAVSGSYRVEVKDLSPGLYFVRSENGKAIPLVILSD